MLTPNSVLGRLCPCVSAWKNPSRTPGCKWGLLKVKKGNTKGIWWALTLLAVRACFSSLGAFKNYSNPWGGLFQLLACLTFNGLLASVLIPGESQMWVCTIVMLMKFCLSHSLPLFIYL
jgi:hypothetical protein